MTKLIISNEEMDDIVKILKFPQKSDFQENASKTIKNEEKKPKVGFLACY